MSSPTSTSRPTVLITGASTGIGLELARLFASGGATAKTPAITTPYNLILLARSRPKLTEVAERLAAEFGIGVQIVTADLSHPKSPEEVFAYLNETGTQIDALVNNAAFGANGNVAVLDMQLQLEMIQTNVTSLVHLTKLFLPQIIQRRGRIMNVASTAAFQPGPHMAIYYASKAFVLSFSEALAEEVEPHWRHRLHSLPRPHAHGIPKSRRHHQHENVQRPIHHGRRPVALEGFQGLMKGKAPRHRRPHEQGHGSKPSPRPSPPRHQDLRQSRPTEINLLRLRATPSSEGAPASSPLVAVGC